MKDQRPEAIALKFVECINNQDIDGLVSLMTEGFTMITDEGEPEIGREVMWEGFRSYLTDFPEYRIHVERVARSGNDIAIVGKTTGSHIPPEIEEGETVIWIAKIEDDLVAEWRIFSDMDVELVAAMLDLSEAYLYEARLDDALKLLGSDVVELLARELPPEEMVRIQVQRAKILRFRNQLDGSSNDATLELLYRAEGAARSLDDKGLFADVAILIGSVLYSQELWVSTLETPRAYFERALALRREIDDQKGVVEALFQIGTTYQNKADRTDEDLERAFALFQEAYALAAEGGFAWEKAHVARHLGYIYWYHIRELDRALAYHQEFLDVNEELGFRLYLPPAHTMVGFAHLELGNPERALEHFESAQAIAEETGYQQPLAEALFGQGLVQEGRGDTDIALGYYERALAIAGPINLMPVVRGATDRIEALSRE